MRCGVPRRREGRRVGSLMRDFFDTNVTGTQHVIAACKKHGVRRLVYTSTPSVVHAGPMSKALNESMPYPKRSSRTNPKRRPKRRRRYPRREQSGVGNRVASTSPHLRSGRPAPHPACHRKAAKAGKLHAHRLAAGESRRHLHRQQRSRTSTLPTGSTSAPRRRRGVLHLERRTGGAVPFSIDRLFWPKPECRRCSAACPRGRAKLAGRLLEFVYWLFRLAWRAADDAVRCRANSSTSHWYDISCRETRFGVINLKVTTLRKD